MKQLFLILAAIIVSLSISAQGKSGEKGKGKDKKNASVNQSDKKGNGKQKDKVDKEKKEHDSKVWDGTHENDNDGPKASKNQPAKVRAAFQRDYPNAQNVTWSKYRGDWTATFRNGVFMSTAVYHANGDRRDTRTPVARQELPRNIFDDILKRRPQTQLDETIKVELPERNRFLYRVKEILDGKAKFYFVDSNGKEVNYNY